MRADGGLSTLGMRLLVDLLPVMRALAWFARRAARMNVLFLTPGPIRVQASKPDWLGKRNMETAS